MAYIVKRKINDRDYYYLQKSKREKDKVKSVFLGYLGKTRRIAEARKKEILKELMNKKSMKNMEDEKKEKVELEKKEITIEELTNFCKSKGFVFKSSEIYGGLAGFWDFGPLGVELFNNIKKEFWNWFVQRKENVIGIEASIISHPKTWQASGHIKNFNDVAVICKKCKDTTKIDKSEIGRVNCEKCHGEFDVQGEFSLMFKTQVGSINPIEAYLRGETAQGMFMDFKLAQQTSRMQLPFGICQIGKCFRNEIAPRDFLFRSREFSIGEIEFFINPEDFSCPLLEERHLKLKVMLLDKETQDAGSQELNETTIGKMLEEKRLEEWHAYWLAEQILWFYSIGLKELKIREHRKDELSHYSSATFDIDYEYPFGSREIAGIANRGQYDLTQHQIESKESMEVFDEKSGKKVLPKVIEPTFGIERVFLATLVKAYNYDKKRENIVLRLPAKLAPVKAAVFPIIKKPEFEEIAENLVKDLKKEFNINYDRSGSIGRRYARNDEIGTPYCVTIDEDSLKNEDVTVRLRDTTEQVRIKVVNLKEAIRWGIEGGDIKKFGKIVDTRKK